MQLEGFAPFVMDQEEAAITQTHESTPSAPDHANVRFFPPLAYAAPKMVGVAIHLALSDSFLAQG